MKDKAPEYQIKGYANGEVEPTPEAQETVEISAPWECAPPWIAYYGKPLEDDE